MYMDISTTSTSTVIFVYERFNDLPDKLFKFLLFVAHLQLYYIFYKHIYIYIQSSTTTTSVSNAYTACAHATPLIGATRRYYSISKSVNRKIILPVVGLAISLLGWLGLVTNTDLHRISVTSHRNKKVFIINYSFLITLYWLLPRTSIK